MGSIMIIMDAAGELGVMLNVSELGGFVADQENLGTVWDAQKLGSVLDVHQLGFHNMSQLNDIFFNVSELGMVTGLNPNWPPKVF